VFAWLKTIKREWRKSFKYYVNSEIDFTAFIKIKETALRKKIESYSKNSTWAVVEKVVEQALKRGVDVIVVYKFYANGKEFVNAKSYDKLLLKEIPKIGDKIKIKYSSFDPRLSGIYHKIISKKTGWIAVQKLTFEVSEE